MAVKVLRKDIIPKYYVCEYNSSILTLHENLTKYECINRVTPSKTAHNLEGKHINEWTVGFYMGDRKWLCQCSCGRYCAITGYNLECNKTISCGHERVDDLHNKTFGDWKVLEYAGVHNGMSQWLCQCSCGNNRIVSANRLKSGRSKSCGHNTNAFNDLTNKQFGEWMVIKYIGNKMWQCKCSCGTVKEIESTSLIRGYSKSCGHLTKEIRYNTMINKYNEVAINKDFKRELWQIEAVRNKESLHEYILNNFKIPTTAQEISAKLRINTFNVYQKIHSYGLDDLIHINYNSSKYEDELYNILVSLGLNVIRRFKTSNGKEIDLFIEDKQLGIEFNGSYWHSEIYKDKEYHQQKSLYCMNNNIRLIHIFEYEWLDLDNRNQLIELIKNAVGISNKVYARNTYIKEIDNIEADEFLNKYHLQGSTSSSIRVGCFNKNNELIGVMTLGIPRFNKGYQYELHRLCWKPGINVIGGIEKLFAYTNKRYELTSLISYVDLSKFYGKSYEKIGLQRSNITQPSYVWYNTDKKEKLSRYQTQKHKLIAINLGTEDETESDIMHRLGYVKIYNCGNIVMTLNRKEQE